MDPIEQSIASGQRVALLLRDEAMQQVFAACEDAYERQWKTGASVEAREAAWAGYHALQEVKKRMQTVVDQGHWAQIELDKRTQ